MQRITSLVDLPDDKKITIADVACVLQIGYSKAYEIVAGGDIEFIRIGRSIRVEVRALREYIDDRRRGGARRSSIAGLKKAI